MQRARPIKAAGSPDSQAANNDNFGNQTTDTKKVTLQPDAVTTTGYNAASQTKRVTAPDGTWVEYNYDGLERMVSRQDSAGSVVMFFHDGLSQQIAVETNAAATVTSRYLVDAFGVPRGKLDIGNSTGRTYYMTDPRGNVTQMIGYLDQAVKAVFAYDPYGKDKPALSKKIASSNWDSRLKFQMAPRDPKTGSYSLGARLMNPTINRFVGADNYVAAGANLGLQVDPLTGNRYLYAGANPAGLIDDGHGWLDCKTGLFNDPSRKDGRCLRVQEHLPTEVLMFAPGYDCVRLAKGRADASKSGCAWDVTPMGKFDELGTFIGAVGRIGKRLPSAPKSIKITNEALSHISERHVWNGSKTSGKSVFFDSEDIASLVKGANRVKPVTQKSDRLQYTLDAGRTVGVDRTSGLPTSMYTVITDPKGKLVTAFPGAPL